VLSLKCYPCPVSTEKSAESIVPAEIPSKKKNIDLGLVVREGSNGARAGGLAEEKVSRQL
jgi:hypothetical protein